MHVYLPETIDLTRLDDKKAYFCDYVYTYNFRYKKQLAEKSLKIGKYRGWIGRYSLEDINSSCYNGDLVAGSSFIPYSNVVHSENYSYSERYVPIYSKDMRSVISVHDYGRAKTELINDSIITCDGSYSNFDGNKKTMRYAFSESHRFATPVVYEIQGKRFENKLRKLSEARRKELSPLEQALANNLYEIDFDEQGARQYLKTAKYDTFNARIARENAINIMTTKNILKYRLRRSKKVGRIFTPVTSSPKDMRRFMQYKEPLVEVDISCALPLLFNKYLINESASDVQLYKWLTSDNGEIDLYEYLGTGVWKEEFPIWNKDARDNVKILVMVIFFGKQSTIQHLRRKFENEFPTVSRIMKQLKIIKY